MEALNPSTPELHLSLPIAVVVAVKNWPYVPDTKMEELEAQEMACWLTFF